jgi:hypothetical protein
MPIATAEPIIRPDFRECALGECVRPSGLPNGGASQQNWLYTLKLDEGRFIECRWERRGDLWEFVSTCCSIPLSDEQLMRSQWPEE